MNSGSAKTLTIDILDQPVSTTVYYPFGDVSFDNGSILVSASTNLTFTLEAANDDDELIWIDVTADLFGVATLAPGNYFFDTNIAVKNMRIASLSAAALPNKGNVYWFMKKNGGR